MFSVHPPCKPGAETNASHPTGKAKKGLAHIICRVLSHRPCILGISHPMAAEPVTHMIKRRRLYIDNDHGCRCSTCGRPSETPLRTCCLCLGVCVFVCNEQWDVHACFGPQASVFFFISPVHHRMGVHPVLSPSSAAAGHGHMLCVLQRTGEGE